MKKKLIELEKEFDKQVNDLKLYEQISFQSIYSFFLYRASIPTLNSGEGFQIIEDLSRISYIYNTLKQKCQSETFESTTEALSKENIEEQSSDINFLYAYTHFCMLMPQVWRGTLIVKSIEGRVVELDFADKETLYAEKIDRLYSAISSPFSFKPINSNEFEHRFNQIVENQITEVDLSILLAFYNHHYRFNLNVKVLSNKKIKDELKFSHEDIDKIFAFLKAFSDYSITLSRKHHKYGKQNNSDSYMSEHFEWSVCLLKKKKFIDILTKITMVDEIAVNNVLSYFTDIYDIENLSIRPDIYEGFLTPFTSCNENIVFSPYSLRGFLSFNNILYSINKNEKTLFDEKISDGLEPILINQIKYLFENFKDLECETNILYQESETDILVLSKRENVCLAIQVKSTISPSSSRATQRVQDRVIEALSENV